MFARHGLAGRPLLELVLGSERVRQLDGPDGDALSAHREAVAAAAAAVAVEVAAGKEPMRPKRR